MGVVDRGDESPPVYEDLPPEVHVHKSLRREICRRESQVFLRGLCFSGGGDGGGNHTELKASK